MCCADNKKEKLLGNSTSYGMLCAVLALIPVLAMVCCELDGKDKWTRKKSGKINHQMLVAYWDGC